MKTLIDIIDAVVNCASIGQGDTRWHKMLSLTNILVLSCLHQEQLRS